MKTLNLLAMAALLSFSVASFANEPTAPSAEAPTHPDEHAAGATTASNKVNYKEARKNCLKKDAHMKGEELKKCIKEQHG